MDEPKVKYVILGIMLPDPIPATNLLSLFNPVLQKYVREHAPEYGPIDYHISIIGKVGLDRRPID